MEIISIHSLRMEGDRLVDGFRQTIEGFQSTPSAWRETGLYDAFYGKKTNFNPLPPHGGRPTKVRSFILDWKFQSTPSAWRETPAVPTLAVDVSFQSTPSAWRETVALSDTSKVVLAISIHSLRMEGDALVLY